MGRRLVRSASGPSARAIWRMTVTSGYISRKQTHIHKLAIVLAAAQRDKLIIEESDLREADALLTTIEPHMIKVFESVGVVDEIKNT